MAEFEPADRLDADVDDEAEVLGGFTAGVEEEEDEKEEQEEGGGDDDGEIAVVARSRGARTTTRPNEPFGTCQDWESAMYTVPELCDGVVASSLLW